MGRTARQWLTLVGHHPGRLTRAVERLGRLLAPVYEVDDREVAREAWRRARRAFDAACEEVRGNLLAVREQVEGAREDAA